MVAVQVVGLIMTSSFSPCSSDTGDKEKNGEGEEVEGLERQLHRGTSNRVGINVVSRGICACADVKMVASNYTVV